jgi:hypothetical protein
VQAAGPTKEWPGDEWGEVTLRCCSLVAEVVLLFPKALHEVVPNYPFLEMWRDEEACPVLDCSVPIAEEKKM